jgi:cytochrome c553
VNSSKVSKLSLLLGIFLIFGLPIGTLLKSLSTPEANVSREITGSHPSLLASHSDMDRVYSEWQARYAKNGGDRNVIVGLGWVRGLSQEFSTALGRVDLDMLHGEVSAEVEDLGGTAADVWLVDNQDGPGKSVMPEAGDRMVRVGRLEPQGRRARVKSSLGRNFFDGFELDLIVVTRAGKTPAESVILCGSRPFYERLYTRARLARQRASGGSSVASLLSPSSLASLLAPREAEANQLLVAQGLVSQQVDDGANLFFRGTFSGNGRTCGTCHPVSNNQTIDQAFIATLPANDPLFIAEIPATQGGVPGLEKPTLMRNFGLILENVDGFQDPTVKFVMRSVPHTLSMATSILAPSDGRAAQQRVGWSGDGAPAPVTLRLFPVGAVTQHFTKSLNRVAGVDFVLPTDTQLDAMEAFTLSVGRLNELNLAQVSLSDPGAEAGRLVFNSSTQGKCFNCHSNAGANVPAGTNNNFNTGVERFPNPARQVQSFPFDGGFGATAPFDCDGNGVADCFGDGTFNSPPLIEAADTPPFFHSHIANTIEDAVAFFNSPEFQASPAGQFLGGINLTAQQQDDVADFLRVLNASFNLALSMQRNAAAISLENSSFQPIDSPSSPCPGPIDGAGFEKSTCSPDPIPSKVETVNDLLRLANVEAQDAIDDLEPKGLHADAVTLLRTAISQNNQAIVEGSSKTRKSLMSSARSNFAAANAKFGTGLNFTLGGGNLEF